MDALEYIVKDALMTCDKGAAPAFFVPLYNMQTKVNGCLATTVRDSYPMANIPTFGLCTVTQSPCMPVTTMWQKTYQAKVRGAQTLLGRSCMQCGVGGKIEFVTSGQIPLPPEALEDIKALQEAGKEEDDSGFGWLDAVEMIPVVGSIVGAVREGAKGNWGMMAMNIGFLAMDVAGLVTGGATTIAATAAKSTIKAGVKVAAKSAAKAAAKVVGKSGLKTGTKLTAKGAGKAFKNSIDDIVRKASGGKLCVFACFPAGTPVHTELGIRNIEDVKVGDKVWSQNENTGEIALKEVLQTMQKEADITLKLQIGNETIETTVEHPFYTQDGWKDASELETSDTLQSRDNIKKSIDSTEYSYNSKKVFNFEVSDWHTYFVGVLGWLVHNAIKCLSELPEQIHHLASNKSKKFTKEFERIIKKYKNLELDQDWNKAIVPHRGRHPDKYHQWVLKKMKTAADKAGRDSKKFEEIFKETVVEPVKHNPWLLRKAGWK